LTTMRPAHGGAGPRIERTRVVLPAPLEPSKQVMRPVPTASAGLENYVRFGGSRDKFFDASSST
jgi:hypothetical protein